MNEILRQTIRMGGLAAIAVAVAACGSTRHAGGPGGPGGPGPGPDPEPSGVFTEDAGTASEALAAGETLETEELTAAAQSSFVDETSAPAAPGFAISRNEDGGVDVTIAGETHAFTDQDVEGPGNGWERQENGDYAGVFSWNGPVDQVLDENTPANAQIWSYFIADGDGEMLDGYAVVGTETTPDAVAARSATAEYRGYATMRVREFDDHPGDRADVQAGTPNAQAVAGADTGLRMTADFDAGTISGEIDGIVATRTVDSNRQNLPQPIALPGTVTMQAADITGNGYDGAMSGTVDGLPVTGTYQGKFFGANAEETGGIMTVEDNEGHGYGAYRAFEVQD